MSTPIYLAIIVNLLIVGVDVRRFLNTILQPFRDFQEEWRQLNAYINHVLQYRDDLITHQPHADYAGNYEADAYIQPRRFGSVGNYPIENAADDNEQLHIFLAIPLKDLYELMGSERYLAATKPVA